MNRIALSIVTGLAMASSAAFAHTPWLKPSQFTVPQAEKAPFIDVDLSVGEQPFMVERALKPSLLQLFSPEGEASKVQVNELNALRSNAGFTLSAPGSYKLQADFGPELRKPKPGMEGKRPALKTFNRLVSFITVGAPSKELVWASQPSRYLDVKPLTDAADMVAGEPIALVLLNNGQPAAGMSVEVIKAGGQYRNQTEQWTLTTDAAGVVRLTAEQAGLYWLKASAVQPLSNDPDVSELRMALGVAIEVQVN